MTDRDTSHADPDDEHATFARSADEVDAVDHPAENSTSSGPYENDDADDFATDMVHQSDEETGVAADLFETIAGAGQARPPKRPLRYDALVRGDHIGDFRILKLLGKGSFGAVYLARELTLDRLVAVKVVLPEGKHATAGEGRSLARLKHPNIVGVYGEAHDSTSGCSLLWMQYVDGCNLANLIERLQKTEGDWTEDDMLRLISDADTTNNTAGDEDDDRETRGTLEMVCRIGHRLSRAMSHAHGSGVTHRDIKPANILMQRDGTPLLADFNLADNEADEQEASAGGTIAYMPPEQFAQVLGEEVTFDAARADIYSLGMVLWEMASGERPHRHAESSITTRGSLRLKEYLRVRREPLPIEHGKVPIGMAMVLGRAMSVDPEKRYPSARAMATALSGLEELQRARRRAPDLAGIRQFIRRNLFWIILIGGVLPHIAASILQIWYNHIRIGTPGEAFSKALIAYNIVVYPACVGWMAMNLYRFARGYRKVVNREPIPRAQLRKLRSRLMKLPSQFTIASAVGWFPGVILFPWLLGVFGQPTTSDDWFHYGISFTMAGLIATTYSYAIVNYIAVCHGYRSCWQTGSQYKRRARAELSGMQGRIRRVSILVGILPLAAAVLLLALEMRSMGHVAMPVISGVETAAEQLAIQEEWIEVQTQQMRKHEDQMVQLRLLVIALIVAGAIGLYVVQIASARLIDVVSGLTLSDE